MQTQPTSILAQLGGARFLSMVGARKPATNGDSVLSFGIESNNAGANMVVIRCAGSVYEIDFWRTIGGIPKKLGGEVGLTSDGLRAAFTAFTGITL